jgi:PAS domain S-box-containing protein
MADDRINQDSVTWRTLMQAALDWMDEGFSVFDVNLRLLAWNKRFLEQYDIPTSYARVGTRFEDFMRLHAERGEYGPGDVEQQIAERVALARLMVPHAFERTLKNGRVIEVRGNPIPGIGFVTVYNDITERRCAQIALEESRQQLEARVRERTAELQASEQWIRLVADAVPVLIGYIDAAGRYRFANRLHEEWFGLSTEQMVGQPIEQIVRAAFDAEVGRHIGAALAGQAGTHELRVRPPGGREIVAVVTARPHIGANGEVLGCFLLGQDVTEQRHAEAVVRQGQKMQAVGQLTGGLAHDFNNLLTIVIGNLALAVDEDNIDEETRTLIDPALAAARRGAAVVRRLLAFARQQPIAPQIYNAKQVVAGMEELLLRTLGGSIRFEMRLSGKPCLIRADPNELETAVLNLAINSRDAMPNGGRLDVSIDTVTLEAGGSALQHDLPAGDYVVIAVTDSGCGMPHEVVERAFEPFFTTKQLGGGSGLGLSMVYGFARRSGGMAEIDSEVGRGTTVRIVLPRVVADAAPVVEAGREPARAPQGRERVLVVEDEAAVRELTTMMLRRLGYAVVAAEDGEAALRALERNGVDLVLTDVDLPGGINGIELARRAQQRFPSLAVLLMSGHPDKALAQARGGDDRYELIAKPFESAELARMVRTALGPRAKRATAEAGRTSGPRRRAARPRSPIAKP